MKFRPRRELETQSDALAREDQQALNLCAGAEAAPEISASNLRRQSQQPRDGQLAISDKPRRSFPDAHKPSNARDLRGESFAFNAATGFAICHRAEERKPGCCIVSLVKKPAKPFGSFQLQTQTRFATRLAALHFWPR